METIMALQKNYTTSSGIELSEAYHRIMKTDLIRVVSVGGSVLDEADGVMQIWKDSTARSEGLSPIQSFQFSINASDYNTFFGTDVLDQTNVNSVAQMYGWVKTQTDLNGIDYTDSTDV